jgi:hypothetical protein
MAAAIRHAARRISVQRAVEPPRLVNTGPVNPKVLRAKNFCPLPKLSRCLKLGFFVAKSKKKEGRRNNRHILLCIYLQPHGLTADQKKDAAIRMALIDNKTEELYNLVAGFKAKYTVKGSVGQKYTNLMNQLSVQIQPRHDDPGW